jgi:hypothetical protein
MTMKVKIGIGIAAVLGGVAIACSGNTAPIPAPSGAVPNVSPDATCATPGQFGVSAKGVQMICARSIDDHKYRWLVR